MNEKKSDDINIELDDLSQNLKCKMPNMISDIIKKFELSLSKLIPEEFYLIDTLAELLVRNKYNSQPLENKKLPVCRFWKIPNNLQERCIQFIASDIIENGAHYDRKKLPPELNEPIDGKIKEVSEGISVEKFQFFIQKPHIESKENFTDFYLSLNQNQSGPRQK